MTASANVLYLKHFEKPWFDGLTKEMRDEWVVEEENLTYADSEEKRQIRMQFLRLRDPAFAALHTKMNAAKSLEECADLLTTFDFSSVNAQDMSEFVYAMGPDVFTVLIATLFHEVKSHKDMEQIASLCALRHLLFQSMSVRPA